MTDKRISIRLAMDGKSEFKRDNSEVEAHAKTAFGGVKSSIDGATASTDDLVAALKRASAEESTVLANASRTSTAKGQAAARDLIGIDPTSAAKAKVSAAAITAELKAMDKQAQAVRYSLDPLAMATDRFAAAEATLDKLLKNGKITLDQHGAALKNEKAALDAVTAAHDKGAKAVGLSSGALRMMAVSTLPDLAQGLLAGQFSFASFVNQAGQAVQIAGMQPGGFGAALGSLLSPAALAGLAITSVGAATALLALEMHKGAEENVKFTNAVLATGNAAGITASQFYGTAQTVAKATETSTSAVQALELQIVRSGKVGAESFGVLTTSSIRLAEALGQKPEEALSRLIGLTDDTARGSAELNKQLHFLTETEWLQIRALQEAGDKSGAFNLALEAVDRHLQDSTKNMGSFERVIRSVSGAWDGFTAKLKDAGRTQTAAEQIAQIQSALNRPQNRGSDKILVVEDGGAERLISRADALRRVSDLQRTINRQQQQANAEARKGAEEQGKIDRDIVYGKGQDDLTKVNEAIAATTRDLANARTALASATKGSTAADEAQAKVTHYQNLLKEETNKKSQVEKQLNPAAPGAGRAASLAREAESVKVNTEATLDLASAYLTSNSAALKAEATRKAMTDATRKGTDVAAAVQRQIDLTNAQAVLSGAKAAAASREQAAAQKAVNDQVATGLIPARDAQQTMQQEAILRPLIALRTNMQGKALEALNETIKAATEGLRDLNAEQQRANLLAASDANADQLAYLEKQLELIDQTNAARGVALAQFQTAQTIGKNSAVNPDNPDAAFAAAVDLGISSDKVARGKVKVDAGTYTEQTTKDAERQRALMAVEQSMLGQKQSAIDKAIALKEAELDIDRAGVDLTREQRDAILGAVAAREDENAQLERGRAIQGEIRGMQDQIGDRLQQYLMDGKISWKSLGDVAENVLNDIMAEVVKLALVNPFKNWAFGQDNATLGSGGIGDLLTKIFSLGGHANGTESAVPGWKWVGERGPELMKMRAGDVVRSNPVSNAMTRSPFASQPRQQPVIVQPVFQLNADGAVMTEQLINGLNKQAQGFATQAAKQAYEEAVKTSARGLKGNIKAINRRKAL